MLWQLRGLVAAEIHNNQLGVKGVPFSIETDMPIACID
jgi:hypothetical protein